MDEAREHGGKTMSENRLTPEELVQSIQSSFPKELTNVRLEKRTSGSMKTAYSHLWMRVDRGVFKDVVKHLFTLDPHPHFAVSSGYDLGMTIELVYHFSLFHGERGKEISVNLTVALPKNHPEIETITDLIPGALISEQEKQEMLGVKIRGIPQNHRMFIADEFPNEVYPWRRDETSPEKLIKNLHEAEK
jgi:membrane-bound hydrogenase subunit beta